MLREELRGNNCGHEFDGRVRHEVVKTSDPLEHEQWVPARDYSRGVKCPVCAHEMVGLRDS